MIPGLLLAALMVCPPPDAVPERLVVPVAAVAAGPQKVSGTWTRDTEMTRMTFGFGETKLTISLTFAPPEGANVPGFTATLDADYSVSPEGVLYGVITGGDAEPACIGSAVQLFVGHPIALRARTEGTITTIRDVKFFGASVPSYAPTKKEPKGIEEMTLTEAVSSVVAVTAGRYTLDDGTKKPMKKAAATATAGLALGILGQARGPQVMGTTDTVTIVPSASQVPMPTQTVPPRDYPQYFPPNEFPNGPPPRLPPPPPPVPTGGATPPALPVVYPASAVPTVTAPPPVVPTVFPPITPNKANQETSGTPPLLGADASLKPLGMIPTGRASQGLLSRPTAPPPPPPPVGVIPAPTAVDKAIEDAIAKLGTDPGIPAYYEMAVKEVDGVSVTMTWTANTFVNRIYFDIQTAVSSEGNVWRTRTKISANFAQGKDGVFYGIVTDVDGDKGYFSSGIAVTKALTGALFKFTQKEVDGKMETRDVVILSATAEKGDLNGIAEALAGKYTGSPGKPAGPPKPLPGRHVERKGPLKP